MSFQKNIGAVRRYAKAMRFGAWLQSLPQRMTPPPFRLIQVGSAFWQSRALYLATRLDIAGVLGDDSLDAQEVATRVHCDTDAVARLLRFLSALGIFEEAGARRYRNNKVSAHLRCDHPQCVRAMILMHNSEIMSRPWYEQLEAGVREGTPPFELTHGETLFDHLDHQPEFDRLFSEAMDSVETLSSDAFATDFDWSRFGRIIDVGGSRGTKSLAILRRHPHLEVLVIDRPQVIAEAQRYWAAHPAPGAVRLQFAAGDVLMGVMAARDSRDVFLLSAVLHAMDDDTASKALCEVAGACGLTGARVAVIEVVLPETGADAAGASFDMQMLMGSRGRERTAREWLGLFERCGLVREELVRLQSFASIQVLKPSSRTPVTSAAGDRRVLEKNDAGGPL